MDISVTLQSFDFFFYSSIAEFYKMGDLVGMDYQKHLFHMMINMKLESRAALWMF